LVYKFDESRNVYDVLPMHAKGDWQYLLGVDLGYEDDSAFVVVAYHEWDKNLYIVDSYNKSHMDITDVATKIRELKAKYDIHKIVIDGANKQAVEEIQKRHQIPLITAERQGKSKYYQRQRTYQRMARTSLERKRHQKRRKSILSKSLGRRRLIRMALLL
jgi:hypothetical protein